ncbi:MAG: OmpA family protein [Chitinophagales bacterium]
MKSSIIITIIMLLLAQTSLLVSQTATPTADNDYIYQVQAVPLHPGASYFAPTFHADGLVFSKSKRGLLDNGIFPVGAGIDLFYAERQSDSSLKNLEKFKIKNEGGDITGVSFSADGKQIYFTRNKKQTSDTPTWGIFISNLEGTTQAGESQRFIHNYVQYDVMHPCITADNQTLYFASDQVGGFGGLDLYVCYRIGNSWSRPENLGPEINSVGHEAYPFLHADGTLYFSSNGHESLGGMDVFYTTKTYGRWIAPQNMNAPINSTKDDFGFIIQENKKDGGYFSSNRGGSKAVLYQILVEKESDFASFVVKEENVNENASTKEKQFTKNVNMYFADDNRPILNDVVGMVPLHFEAGDWKVSDMAKLELDKLANYLKHNSHIITELSVHTDARGSKSSNKELSRLRAEGIKAYLESKQISPNRLDAVGYGEAFLVNFCKDGMFCPEELHEQNNRLEVRLIENQNVTYKWTVQNQPIHTKPQTVPVVYADNVRIPTTQYYEVVVGPVENSENRIYRELRAMDSKLDFEHTPKGKVFKLGPYTEEKAQDCKQEIEQNGLKKARISVAEQPKNTKSKPTKNKHIAKYQIYVGPFKHVSNDTFHKFKELDTEINLKHTSKGMMIVMGPFESKGQVEQYEYYAKQRATKKTKVMVYSGGKIWKSEKGDDKNTKKWWKR